MYLGRLTLNIFIVVLPQFKYYKYTVLVPRHKHKDLLRIQMCSLRGCLYHPLKMPLVTHKVFPGEVTETSLHSSLCRMTLLPLSRGRTLAEDTNQLARKPTGAAGRRFTPRSRHRHLTNHHEKAFFIPHFLSFLYIAYYLNVLKM